MNRTTGRAILWVLLTLAAGCATLPPPAQRPTETAPPATPRSEEAAPAPPRSGPAERRGATVALLADADALEHSGELDRAAAVLERALRIAPDDPLLWHRLASVRLRQGRVDQAEQLARKSNLLASSDPALQARNWQLIADARRSRGDEAGARIAEEKAGESARRVQP